MYERGSFSTWFKDLSLREFVERFEEELPRALRAVRIVEGVKILLDEAQEHLTRAELTQAERQINRSIVELQAVLQEVSEIRKRVRG